MQTHTRLHSGEKPFECKQCSAKFTQFVHLKLHKRQHVADRLNERNWLANESLNGRNKCIKLEDCTETHSGSGSVSDVHSDDEPDVDVADNDKIADNLSEQIKVDE